ncbi:MAG: hypothetical protein H0V60_10700 [Actinobacteria bacterium]|jgi:hypothetical protein|nr:hypothetical protein [Actinomycetota bacterium]
MRDTRLEAEGAEFLVLAHLLIEGMEAHKAYTTYPGYDVIALNPSKKRQCRIQVKSRYLTGDRVFGIRNFDCDFVVFAKLNRATPRGASPTGGVRPPELYVLPIDVVHKAKTEAKAMNAYRVRLAKIENADSFLNDWSLIKRFLDMDPS